jgi:hypothetical protein
MLVGLISSRTDARGGEILAEKYMKIGKIAQEETEVGERKTSRAACLRFLMEVISTIL